MRRSTILLRITGFIFVFYAISHAAFEKVFNWRQNLLCLSKSDRAIFLTYHYELILLLIFMSVILIMKPSELLKTSLKYLIVGMFIVFLIIRILTEFIFFGYLFPQSPVIIMICLLPAILLLTALNIKNK